MDDKLVKWLRGELPMGEDCIAPKKVCVAGDCPCDSANAIAAADRITELEEALRKIGRANKSHYRYSPEIDEIILRMLWTEKDGTKIEKGWLSNRAYRALISNEINTIEDIEEAGANHLLRLPNLGRKTLKEIKEFLASRGIPLLDHGKEKWEQA